eukprot:Amastigsp_a676288_29.p5 type:complete len:100 gc:universal Amastigsp_a676288_29:596-895(+)
MSFSGRCPRSTGRRSSAASRTTARTRAASPTPSRSRFISASLRRPRRKWSSCGPRSRTPRRWCASAQAPTPSLKPPRGSRSPTQPRAGKARCTVCSSTT